ncbi:hypothetical protein ACTZWW_20565 [Salinarimonas sp. NSM]|uniref:hypothetical protein n=1 Tax=Salinarimonas sp. NSM TaxID=3458003 RepID=UPI004035F823
MRAARRFREAELIELGAGWDENVPAAAADRGLAQGLSGLLTALAGVGLLVLAVAPPPPGLEDGPRDIADLLARPDPVLTAPPPAWRALETPQIVLGLDAPGVGGLASRHAARVHGSGAREDALVFGGFAEGGTHLRLTLHRAAPSAAPDAALEAPRAFFVEVALAAAEAGLAIASSGQPEAVATGFGVLEAAPLVLENGPVRACLAFRGGAGPRLSGWLCAQEGTPEATPERLACLVDGLVLLDPGGDAALAEAFARATATRGDRGCADRADPGTVAAIDAAASTATPVRVTAPAPPPRPARLGASS